MSTLTGEEQIHGILSSDSTIVGQFSEPESLAASLTADQTLTASLSSSHTIIGSLSCEGSLIGHLEKSNGGVDVYTGEYEITPGEEEIVLNTNDKLLTRGITIAAIPSNYGLITWNGTTLTIS